MRAGIENIESRITQWMAHHAIWGSRVALGVVFFWFGALKLFPGLSPAEELAGCTLRTLSGGVLEPDLSVPLLGGWECLIGAGFLVGALRLAVAGLFLHMTGTVLPMFLFPDQVFAHVPFVLTFEGQYIVKNLVLISAGLAVGASMRR